ncbi:MAG: hypothetical protein V4691_03190 [Pseudomonadota bacterium]
MSNMLHAVTSTQKAVLPNFNIRSFEDDVKPSGRLKEKAQPSTQEKVFAFFNLDGDEYISIKETDEQFPYFRQKIPGTFDQKEFASFAAYTGFKPTFDRIQNIRISRQIQNDGSSSSRSDGETSYVGLDDIQAYIYGEKLITAKSDDDLILNQNEWFKSFAAEQEDYSFWKKYPNIGYASFDINKNGIIDKPVTLVFGDKKLTISLDITQTIFTLMGHSLGLNKGEYKFFQKLVGWQNLGTFEEADGILEHDNPVFGQRIYKPDGMVTLYELSALASEKLNISANGTVTKEQWDSVLQPEKASVPALPTVQADSFVANTKPDQVRDLMYYLRKIGKLFSK